MIKFSPSGDGFLCQVTSTDGTHRIDLPFEPLDRAILTLTPVAMLMLACLYQPLLATCDDPAGALYRMVFKKYANRCVGKAYHSAPDPEPYRWMRIFANGSKIPSTVYRAMAHHQSITKGKPCVLPDCTKAHSRLNAGALVTMVQWLNRVGADELNKDRLGNRELEYIIRNLYAKAAPVQLFPDYAWLGERIQGVRTYSWEEARDTVLPHFRNNGLEPLADLQAEAICRDSLRIPTKRERRLEHERAFAQTQARPKSIWGES